jgi:chromosome segregation ATPase
MAEAATASRVAATDTWTPSRRLRAAAASERERLERELARLRAREAELSAELDAVRAARAELEQERNVLNHFADRDEPPRSPDRAARRLRALPDASAAASSSSGTTVLRGASIRETAVRVLAANSQPEAPVHYRDWFELLTSQGFMPAGKDPLATFLTQVGRSPVVQRTTTAGMYVLELDFPQRARQRLAELTAALSDAQERSPGATVEDLAAARERRAQLTAQLAEAERQLEEALRSIGEPGAQ